MEANKLYNECESLINKAYDKIELLTDKEDQELFFDDVQLYESILENEKNNITELQLAYDNLKILVSRL